MILHKHLFRSFVLFVVCFSFTTQSQAASGLPFTLTEDQKIAASDGEPLEMFGNAVAVSSDKMVVGAPQDDTNGGWSGSVYVFTNDGQSWNQTAKLTPSDGAALDKFGRSVAISGDVIVAGAADENWGKGSAYVFTFDGQSWNQTVKLTASDASLGDHFGRSVAVSDNVIVVGAPDDDFIKGSAYVFTLNGQSWTQTNKLKASDGSLSDAFGTSVSISGNVIVAGAPGDNFLKGSAYLFTHDGQSWSQTTRIEASDAGLANKFGESVSISGNVVAVGAADADFFQGSAYVFTNDGQAWSQTARLQARDGGADCFFGRSVSVSGDVIAVGAVGEFLFQGAAYAFTFDGVSWNQSDKLLASDGTFDFYFGRSVAVSGGLIAVGADGAKVNGKRPGAAYLFDITTTITATAGVGGEIQEAGEIKVIHGTNRTFTITPDPPFAIQDVTIDGNSEGAVSSYTFETVDADHTIHADFYQWDFCPDDPDKSEPGTCGCGVADTDSDGDGTPDCNDGCPGDTTKVAPGQCGCGVADTDSDGDGTADCNDGCPTDPAKTVAGICGCGVADTDSDGDGKPDCNDGCPGDAAKIDPGQCGCGVADTDSDGDGTADCNDGCPTDPAKTDPGICGCGVADTDSDRDGTADCIDGCPADPAKTAPGPCGCGVADTDSDGDGTPDCNDRCPADAAKVSPGQCGCSVPDTDTDGDGTPDCNDTCPDDPAKTDPGPCGCNIADTDTDNDGTLDCRDGCPDDQYKTTPGTCGCGSPEFDMDGDGISDCNNTGGYSPIADPGPDQNADSGTMVYLDGSASYDPDGTIVNYLWKQTGGPVVGLTDANASKALFVSPETETDDLLLTFDLTVTDNEGLSSSKSVTVTVGKTYDEPCNLPPEVISPENGSIDLEIMPVLVIDKYIDSVSCISHHKTRWQISENPDFHGLVYNRNVFDHDNFFSHQVPPGVLEPNTTYYWKANIHCSSGCTSEYSAISSFTTGDAPNGAGGNGQPGNNGNHSMGVTTVVGDMTVVIETSANITFLQALDNQDQEILEGMPDNMPWGLINFRIEVAEPGDTVQVTISFEEKAANGSVFYKYDPVEGWIDYSDYAVFAPNMKSVTINIQDGGFGDLDGTVNGVIVDPGGIGVNIVAGGGGGSSGCFIKAITGK